MLVDPVSKKPVRTEFRFLPDGTRVRIGMGPNASGEVRGPPCLSQDPEPLYPHPGSPLECNLWIIVPNPQVIPIPKPKEDTSKIGLCECSLCIHELMGAWCRTDNTPAFFQADPKTRRRVRFAP